MTRVPDSREIRITRSGAEALDSHFPSEARLRQWHSIAGEKDARPRCIPISLLSSRPSTSRVATIRRQPASA